MRLWDKNLIKVLPREQLVAQWRELSAIAGAIQKNGTPNHILVNFVLDYDFDHFISYAQLVRDEMTRRGYRTMQAIMIKIISLKPDYTTIPFDNIYEDKMTIDYLQICYWNLYEKFMCGGISGDEWDNIELQFNNTMDKYEN